MFIHSSIIFIDSKSNQILLESNIENKNNNSRKYFLTPTNLTLNRLLDLTPVDNTDNVVALGNMNNLVLIAYDFNSNRIKIFTSEEEKHKFKSFVIGGDFLLGCDLLHSELIGYDLNDKNPLDKIHFKIGFNKDLLRTFGLNSNSKYVYLIEKQSTLKFYRVNDGKKIAETHLYCLARSVICSDEYICLCMQDKRIISFLIVDPLIPNSAAKIKQLESR